MKPIGVITPRSPCYDREYSARVGRAREHRRGERVAREQLEGALHPAELRLIEADATGCPCDGCNAERGAMMLEWTP